MNTTQKSVAAFVRRHELETDVAHRLLDAVSELGEVAKEALKGSAYGRTRFTPTAAWTEELGDVAFSLLCVANSTGVDLDAAVQQALAKYERRIAERGAAGSPPKQKKKPVRRRKTATTTTTGGTGMLRLF